MNRNSKRNFLIWETLGLKKGSEKRVEKRVGTLWLKKGAEKRVEKRLKIMLGLEG